MQLAARKGHVELLEYLARAADEADTRTSSTAERRGEKFGGLGLAHEAAAGGHLLVMRYLERQPGGSKILWEQLGDASTSLASG